MKKIVLTISMAVMLCSISGCKKVVKEYSDVITEPALVVQVIYNRGCTAPTSHQPST